MDVLQRRARRDGCAQFARGGLDRITGFEQSRWPGSKRSRHGGEDAIYAGIEFVIAAGAWSAQLGALLGLDNPLQAGQGVTASRWRRRASVPARGRLLTEARSR
jgi:hypothetical protein